MQTTTTTEPVFTVVMVGPSRQVDITWNLLRRVPMKNYLHWVGCLSHVYKGLSSLSQSMWVTQDNVGGTISKAGVLNCGGGGGVKNSS